MFRDLWALRLASFGNLDRNGGLPFSTSTSPPNSSFPQDERSMNDSLIQVSLPFMENKELFGDYVNIFGGIRFGKILEDLDVFAATCAYMHCGTSTTQGEKLTIVTAAVDRIDVHMRLDEPVNLRMKGMVTFVGKSSMEVTIVVESSRTATGGFKGSPEVSEDVTINQFIDTEKCENPEKSDNSWKLAALAKFIMVAKNSDGPVQVPRLKLNSQREKEIFAAGAERHDARLKRAKQSLFKEPPTEEESKLLHSLFLKPNNGHADIKQVPISSTILTTTKLCHPQERNIHDLIFGGYLMREALELGFTCGILFSRSQLHFLAVDELAFKHPVPIGAVLQLTAQVVYTEEEGGNSNNVNTNSNSNSNNNDQSPLTTQSTHPLTQLIHVEVVADVLDTKTSDRKTTNTFHFTFRLEGPPQYTVRPGTYPEAMKYLEGKRRVSAAPLDPMGTIYKF